MKNLTFLLLFLGLMASAQNNRVIYEYRFRPDSTKTDSLKTEWMYLDISKNGSKYYSKKAFESDSIVAESIKKQMASGARNISISRQRDGGEINYEVEKTYPGYQTYLTASIGNDSYKVAEDRKPDWKIQPEKKKMGEFSVQRATAAFAGRTWEAWFTTDVPIQDGPYKFSGLPGLIVSVSDSSGSHSIELKGLKKISQTSSTDVDTQGRDLPLTRRKPIEVNRQQYAKQLKQYENDPVQGMRELLSRPNSKVKINMNGKEISDPAEILRTMERNARDEIARNNNKIELRP